MRARACVGAGALRAVRDASMDLGEEVVALMRERELVVAADEDERSCSDVDAEMAGRIERG